MESVKLKTLQYLGDHGESDLIVLLNDIPSLGLPDVGQLIDLKLVDSRRVNDGKQLLLKLTDDGLAETGPFEYSLKILGGELRIIAFLGKAWVEEHLPLRTCEFCGLPDCDYNCDESQEGNGRSPGDRLAYNRFLWHVEALAVAHAASGLDIESDLYVAGIVKAAEFFRTE